MQLTLGQEGVYAFVMSDEFGKAAASLTDGLKKKGFDEVEAFKAVEEQLPLQNDLGELFNTPPDAVRLSKDVLDGIVLPDGIRRNDFSNGDGEIVLSGKESDEVIEQVAVQLSKSGNSVAAHILKLKHQQKKAAVANPVPAKTTTWRFPCLVATVDGANLFSADQACETVGKAMSEYLPRTLNRGEISVKDSDPQSFRLPMGGKTDWFYPDFIGELDDGRLFALEYKGSLTGQCEDTVEKDAIGKLWAAQDPKKYVYATIYGDAKSGLSPEQQVNSALA